jgi:uncharacterized protein (TIGR03066 family)
MFPTRILPTTGAAMRAVTAGVATMVLVLLIGGFAAAQDEKIDGKLLVGKWAHKEKGAKELTIEFMKTGRVTFTGGPGFTIGGTYKLDGNKLSLTMRFEGDENTTVRTVNSLSKSELVTTDEKGKKDTFIRVGPQGGDKK